MSDRVRTRAALAAAAVSLAVLIGTGFIGDVETASMPTRGLMGSGGPLGNGLQMSPGEAREVFPVPVLLPNTPQDNDDTIDELWIRLGKGSDDIYAVYESGTVALVTPSRGQQSAREFAAAQAGDGYPGTVEEVGGVDAFIWEPTSDYGGSVRIIVGPTRLVVIGNGRDSGAALRATAASALVDAA
jgi:hypothetical protein